MLFFAFEDAFENFARRKIANFLAVRDGILKKRDGFHFDRQIGLEDFLDRFADLQLVDRLKVGKAVKKQDPFRQHIRVLHLID